jgi:hypothetical protein
MKKMQVARLLAYVTGMVNQQLLLQNEYLVAENRILRSHLPARVPLTDPQRVTLAEIGKRLGASSTASGCLGRQARYGPGLISQANRMQV